MIEEVKPSQKIPKFKVGDSRLLSTRRVTKYKNIFSKGYTKKWSKEIFVINTVLKTNPWTYKTDLINILIRFKHRKNNRKLL